MKLRLLAHIEGLKAEALLASPRAGELTATDYGAAVLAATGDKELARKAFNRRAADMVEAGMKPE